MLVRDIMKRSPLTVRDDEALGTAQTLMENEGIRHLPVLDGAGSLIGMLSARDVGAAIGYPARVSAELVTDLDGLRVKDAMSQPPICVTEEEPVSGVARLFADSRIGALPVVDGRDHVVGIVSYVDVLRCLPR